MWAYDTKPFDNKLQWLRREEKEKQKEEKIYENEQIYKIYYLSYLFCIPMEATDYSSCLTLLEFIDERCHDAA